MNVLFMAMDGLLSLTKSHPSDLSKIFFYADKKTINSDVFGDNEWT